MMRVFLFGVAVGVALTLTIIGAYVTDMLSVGTIWRYEADCTLRPWFAWLRRMVRPVRTERCFACGRVHEMSNDTGET